MFNRFKLKMNLAGELDGGAPAPEAAPAPAPEANPSPAPAGLDFIPESYRSAPWATKYKSADDFFKGVDGMAQLIGKKEIVQGLQAPGAEAPDEEWGKFFNQIGRPESAEKYELPADLQAHEGLNLDEVKASFTSIAHKNGLTQKQAAGLFKDYVETLNQDFVKSQEQVKVSFQEVVNKTFPDNPKAGFDLAKRGAKAAGLLDKIDSEGLSLNPIVLQLSAELGKYVGEDTLESGKGTAESSESFVQEALRLQKSPEYWKDKAVFNKVAELYEKAERLKKVGG
jgi:hypothetical protein